MEHDNPLSHDADLAAGDGAADSGQREGWHGFWIAFIPLTTIGFFVSWVASLGFAMSSDPCLAAGQVGWLCTGWGQQLAGMIPWIGWGLAVASSLVGAAFKRRAAGAPWVGLLIGGALFVIALVSGDFAVESGIN